MERLTHGQLQEKYPGVDFSAFTDAEKDDIIDRVLLTENNRKMAEQNNTTPVIDITQLEVDARTDITNMKSLFGDKPFTKSQATTRIFKGDREKCTAFIEHLNLMGAIIQINADGAVKFQLVSGIEERKANIKTNIEELEEFIMPYQAQLEMLRVLEQNIDKI